MPNGGTPTHMVLRPKYLSLVIHCLTNEIRIFTIDEWENNVKILFPLEEEKENNGIPIAVLDKKETAAIMAFGSIGQS